MGTQIFQRSTNYSGHDLRPFLDSRDEQIEAQREQIEAQREQSEAQREQIEAQSQLIESQRQQIASLRSENESLRKDVAALTAMVSMLTERLNRNSKNSHQPPSSDGPGARAGKETSSKAKRGGQVGHKGFKRELIPAANVTRFVDVFPANCESCWKSLPNNFDMEAS